MHARRCATRSSASIFAAAAYVLISSRFSCSCYDGHGHFPPKTVQLTMHPQIGAAMRVQLRRISFEFLLRDLTAYHNSYYSSMCRLFSAVKARIFKIRRERNYILRWGGSLTWLAVTVAKGLFRLNITLVNAETLVCNPTGQVKTLIETLGFPV